MRCASAVRLPSASSANAASAAMAFRARSMVSGLACMGEARNPGGVRGDEFAEETSRGFVDEFSRVIEPLAHAAQVRFRLLHGGHVEEHHRLPQVMVGPEPAYHTWRDRHYCAGLAAPGALAIGPRADVNGVFQDGGHGTVVFGGHE